MDSSLIALMMLSLLLGCGCWLLFLWAVRDGQFTDIERAKYRMLDDEELSPGVGDVVKEEGVSGVSSGPAVRPLPNPPPPGEGVASDVDSSNKPTSPPPRPFPSGPARRSLGEGGERE